MSRPITLTQTTLGLLLTQMNKQEILSLSKKLGLKTGDKHAAANHILLSCDRIKTHVSFTVPAKQNTTETLDQLLSRHE